MTKQRKRKAQHDPQHDGGDEPNAAGSKKVKDDVKVESSVGPEAQKAEQVSLGPRYEESDFSESSDESGLESGQSETEDEVDDHDDFEIDEFDKPAHHVTDEARFDVKYDLGRFVQSKRVQVHHVSHQECLHEVVVPSGMEYMPLVDYLGEPAKTFTFQLDGFQREAIKCIDNDESVLVSAHTSAGKTAIAEYSIAKSLKLKQKVIYTTPIKALSNQKYKEFSSEFEDVGLMTGDYSINPSGSCVIMTTEILRNMLYRGNKVVREVAWVVFDEIHYMRDPERGVVWEETLMLLPDNVHYVFLSATIPNARQFAEWIALVHNQPTHVVYTEYRPVPLQYYLHFDGDEDPSLILDNGVFYEDTFNLAFGKSRAQLPENAGKVALYNSIKRAVDKGCSPLIIFSFSKKECEAYAMELSNLDLTTVREKHSIVRVYDRAVKTLPFEDQSLPSISLLRSLVMRGIGIHHGGLLPTIKEAVELLFAEGLIRALFATETFAMGLNMPARTVMFSSLRKFDGKNHRNVTAGEFIQMSGRAGRRGKDTQGIVVAMVDSETSAAVIKELLEGKADPLNSAYHITYTMILNTLRVDDIHPDDMLERTFCRYQKYSSVIHLYEKLQAMEDKFKAMEFVHEDTLNEYCELVDKSKQLKKKLEATPRYSIDSVTPYLQLGRLVKFLYHNSFESLWGVLLDFKMLVHQDTSPPKQEIILKILHTYKLDCEDDRPPGPLQKTPPSFSVSSVSYLHLEEVSKVRITVGKQDKSLESITKWSKDYMEYMTYTLRSAQAIIKRYAASGGAPIVPVDPNYTKISKQILLLQDKIDRIAKTRPIVTKSVKTFENKRKLMASIDSMRNQLNEELLFTQYSDLRVKYRRLLRLGFVNQKGMISHKGSVACVLQSSDELVITEAMFAGLFTHLTVPLVCAVLSCFVADESGKKSMPENDDVVGPFLQLKVIAKRVMLFCGKVDDDPPLNPSMMSAVLDWCNGKGFYDIVQSTGYWEGSLVRCFRRLEELLKQLVGAAKVLGDIMLETKFTEAHNTVNRGIVSTQSLYIFKP